MRLNELQACQLSSSDDFFHGSPLCYYRMTELELLELKLHVSWDWRLPHKKKQISKLKSCLKMVSSIFIHFPKKKALKIFYEFFLFCRKSSFVRYFLFPLFFPRPPLQNLYEKLMNINPNVYGAIMCLNRNLKT